VIFPTLRPVFFVNQPPGGLGNRQGRTDGVLLDAQSNCRQIQQLKILLRKISLNLSILGAPLTGRAVPSEGFKPPEHGVLQGGITQYLNFPPAIDQG